MPSKDPVVLAVKSARRYKKYGKALMRSRKAKGLCLSCGVGCPLNPRTGRAYTRCERHRKGIADATRRYSQPRRDRWRAAGLCTDCGEPCGVRRGSGQPYSRCLRHRRQLAELQQRKRLLQKQANKV